MCRCMEIFADLHCHSSLDPIDGPKGRGVIPTSNTYEAALDRAVACGIKVLAFTHHEHLIHTPRMVTAAKKRGILLLPGFEALIEGCDVVLINPTTDNIRTFAQLAAERRRNPGLFVLAPHPFYPGANALGLRLLRHIELFDAIEYCHFSLPYWNVFNWLAMLVAWKRRLPLIGTSDAHQLATFGIAKTRVRLARAGRLEASAVVQALKSREACTVVSRHITHDYLWRVLRGVRLSDFFKGRQAAREQSSSDP